MMEHYETKERIVYDDVVSHVTCDNCQEVIDADSRIWVTFTTYIMGGNELREFDFCCKDCMVRYLEKQFPYWYTSTSIKMNYVKFKELFL